MASKSSSVREVLDGDKRVIDFASLSSRWERNNCFQDIQHCYIKELTLLNFQRKQLFFSFESRKNILRAFTAVLCNPYIETLRLGNEFVKRFDAPGDNLINIGALTKMPSLRELSLQNHDWSPMLFKDLQAWLTGPACKLETLELQNGMPAEDLEQLKTTFRSATSLKYYKGAFQAELQAILDEKIPVLEEAVSARPKF